MNFPLAALKRDLCNPFTTSLYSVIVRMSVV